jgi:hypothetical protein
MRELKQVVKFRKRIDRVLEENAEKTDSQENTGNEKTIVEVIPEAFCSELAALSQRLKELKPLRSFVDGVAKGVC